MPRPPKLTGDAHAEIEAVAAARWEIPSDKELAAKHRVSVTRVQQLMALVRDRLKVREAQHSATGVCHDT